MNRVPHPTYGHVLVGELRPSCVAPPESMLQVTLDQTTEISLLEKKAMDQTQEAT